jgi:hypothetical protein
MSKILSKAEILAASDLDTVMVDVPEWGGSVIIRAMSGLQRDLYETSLMEQQDDGTYKVNTENMRSKLVCFTAVDEAGISLFSGDDLALLAAKSAAVLERLFDAAQKINGLQKGAIEEAAKNSESDPQGASPSGSLSPSA